MPGFPKKRKKNTKVSVMLTAKNSYKNRTDSAAITEGLEIMI